MSLKRNNKKKAAEVNKNKLTPIDKCDSWKFASKCQERKHFQQLATTDSYLKQSCKTAVALKQWNNDAHHNVWQRGEGTISKWMLVVRNIVRITHNLHSITVTITS